MSSKVFNAISEGDLTALKRLIVEDANRAHARNDLQSSPLVFAIQKGKLEIARWLLEFDSSDLDASNQDGYTALMYACGENADFDLARALLEAGADVNVQPDELTALMLASLWGQLELVSLLLDNGAAVDQESPDGTKTALTLACLSEKLDVVALLTNRGASTCLALLTCCSIDRTLAVRVLLENGAHINDVNNRGETGLLLASKEGYREIVESLLEKDAEVDTQDRKGRTALMYACEEGYHEIAKLLLDRGANVNLRDNEGWSALCLACRRDKLQCVEWCFVFGADLHQKNGKDEDALQIAKDAGSLDVVEFLTFLTSSQVAEMLTHQLGFPPRILVAFFDARVWTLEDCESLNGSHMDLLGLSPQDQRRFKECLAS